MTESQILAAVLVAGASVVLPFFLGWLGSRWRIYRRGQDEWTFKNGARALDDEEVGRWLVVLRHEWLARAAEKGIRAEIEWRTRTWLPEAVRLDGTTTTRLSFWDDFRPSWATMVEARATIKLEPAQRLPFLTLESGPAQREEDSSFATKRAEASGARPLESAAQRAWCWQFLTQLPLKEAQQIHEALTRGLVRIQEGVVVVKPLLEHSELLEHGAGDLQKTTAHEVLDRALEVATALENLAPGADEWILSTIHDRVPCAERLRRLQLLLDHYPSHQATVEAREAAFRRGGLDTLPFHLQESPVGVAKVLCSDEALELPASLWLEGLKAVSSHCIKEQYVECLQQSLPVGEARLLRHAMTQLERCGATPRVEGLLQALETTADDEALRLLFIALAKSRAPAAEQDIATFFEDRVSAALGDAGKAKWAEARSEAAMRTLEACARALGQLGSAHSIPLLREAAEYLELKSLRNVAEAAIQEIKARLGDVPTGGLSLLEPGTGGDLSLLQGDGGLSFSEAEAKTQEELPRPGENAPAPEAAMSGVGSREGRD